MPDVPISALDSRGLALAARLREAVEEDNHDVVVALARSVLDRYPGCLLVRRWWQRALLVRSRGAGRWLERGKGSLTRAGFLLRGVRWDDLGPKERVRMADRLIAADPRSKTGLRMLARAAAELEWPETAIFAGEVLAELEPRSPAAGIAWVEALLAGRHGERARAVVEELQRRFPHDPSVVEMSRRVAVAVTMEHGNWEGEGSFRDKLRRKADLAEPST